jgi:hypothetical protein
MKAQSLTENTINYFKQLVLEVENGTSTAGVITRGRNWYRWCYNQRKKRVQLVL